MIGYSVKRAIDLARINQILNINFIHHERIINYIK